MNKLYISLILLFCVAAITVVSCSKDKEVVPEEVEAKRPFVDFSIVPGDDPFTFSFENKSSNYKELEWRFGDDSLSTEVTPQHIYLRNGLFQVNLKATAEDGSTARKLLEINIPTDSVVRIKSVNTDPTTLKFNVTSAAKIKSLLWTFEDNTTSTDLSPARTYIENTLNKLVVQMTTEKGTVVESSKFATTTGIVTDVSSAASLSVSADNTGNVNEISTKILDNTVETKWYITGWAFPVVAKFQFPSAQKIKFYGIGSANDDPTRDPKTWTLEGSNDGTNWEVLDTRTTEKNFFDQTGSKYKQMFYFAIANPKSYEFYKWNVTANYGSGGFQISEFKLYK